MGVICDRIVSPLVPGALESPLVPGALESGSCISREISPSLFEFNFAVLAKQYFSGFFFRGSSVLNLILFFKIS